jgi:NADH-quinone oxidoreductase subunit E
MALSADTRSRAEQIVARYPQPRSALLPMLHLVQSEEGWVSPEGVALCADVLGLTKAEVGAVSTFYTMYKRRPVGDWLVSVCTNWACAVRGGQEVYDRLSDELGVGHEGVTDDGIMLEHAECLAACDYAPVVTVNYEFYDHTGPDEAQELVAALRRGERPAPSRGAPLCTFREISELLAGFPDERRGSVDAGPTGEPTMAGLRLSDEPGTPTASGATQTSAADQPSAAADASQAADAADAGQGRE